MSQRHPKRQRKKEAAAARREARQEALRRQRRTRMVTLAVATAVLVLGGVAIAFFAARGPDEPAAATSPSPAPTPAGEVACGGEVPETAGQEKQTFTEPAPQDLQQDTTYVLRLETSCGQVDITLAHREAPETASSIAFLTRQGFYDGLTFHRIIPDFVVQGGDPKGDGTGGPGYKVVEAPPQDIKYTPGVVAMAKAGPEEAGTSGSQFFIVSGNDAESLEPIYALLGNVTAGMDVVRKIAQVGSVSGEPEQKVFIEKATIVEL